MSKNIWLGSLISFTGVALVSVNGPFSLSGSPMGYGLAIVAALMWAFYSVIVRRIGKNYSALYITRRTFFYAILTLLPVFIFRNITIDWSVLKEPVNYLNLLFLGVFASCIAYVLWTPVVRRLGAVTANNFIYLSPLFIVLTGALVLHEQLTIQMITGGVLIVAGLYVSERKGKTDC